MPFAPLDAPSALSDSAYANPASTDPAALALWAARLDAAAEGLSGSSRAFARLRETGGLAGPAGDALDQLIATGAREVALVGGDCSAAARSLRFAVIAAEAALVGGRPPLTP